MTPAEATGLLGLGWSVEIRGSGARPTADSRATRTPPSPTHSSSPGRRTWSRTPARIARIANGSYAATALGWGVVRAYRALHPPGDRGRVAAVSIAGQHRLQLRRIALRPALGSGRSATDR